VLQSAYKEFHSTETGLLQVHNDITLNIDHGNVIALTLLGFYAAFDTIDYNTLIERLCIWKGPLGTALTRRSSDLTDVALWG